MRLLVSALLLILIFSQLALGQTKRDPKPQEDIVDLDGFLTEGGMVNFAEGESIYEHPGAAAEDEFLNTATGLRQIRSVGLKLMYTRAVPFFWQVILRSSTEPGRMEMQR